MEFEEAVLSFIKLSEELKPRLRLGQLEANSESQSIFKALNPSLTEDFFSSVSPDEHYTKMLIAEALDCLHYLMHHSHEHLSYFLQYLKQKGEKKAMSDLPKLEGVLSSALETNKNISQGDIDYEKYCDHMIKKARDTGGSHSISIMPRSEWKPNLKKYYSCFPEHEPNPSAFWWRLTRKGLISAVGGRYKKKRLEYIRNHRKNQDSIKGLPVLRALLLDWIPTPAKKSLFIQALVVNHRDNLFKLWKDTFHKLRDPKIQRGALGFYHDLGTEGLDIVHDPESYEQELRAQWANYLSGVQDMFRVVKDVVEQSQDELDISANISHVLDVVPEYSTSNIDLPMFEILGQNLFMEGPESA